MSDVSGNRPQTMDRQRKRATESKPVGLAVITYLSTASVVCSCGWGATHSREKVLEDAVDRHLSKVHLGRGIRL